MTHSHETPSAPSAPRSNSDYRWTQAKALIFLQELAMHGDVSAAARHVGMSRQSAYRLRARLAGGPFDRTWSAAQKRGRARTAEASKFPGWEPR